MLGMSYTSCSLNLLPGIECPLCRNRLYRTFPKKSTPFSKKFPELTASLFPVPMCVKGKFSTNLRSTKNCTKEGILSVSVFRCYVNESWMWETSPHGWTVVDNSCGEVCGECGKPLVFHSYWPPSPVDGSVENSASAPAQAASAWYRGLITSPSASKNSRRKRPHPLAFVVSRRSRNPVGCPLLRQTL